MSLQGKLGELFLKSHGVDLTPETAVLNELTLKNADLKMCLADTTAQDTTQSTPTFWKFDLRKIDLSNVNFQMDMPLDTLNFGIHIKDASLRNGFIDLHKEAYSVRTFKLLNSQMFYNSGNSAPLEKVSILHILPCLTLIYNWIHFIIKETTSGPCCISLN